MYKFLRIYRGILNSQKVPEPIKRKVLNWGLRLFHEVFKARHTRLELYKLHVVGDLYLELWLDWQDYTDAGYIVNRIWEEPNTRFILNLLKPGDIAVDLGANVGYVSLLMSKLVGDSKVIAVEPMLRNRYILEKNARQNNADNLILEPVAVGMVEGETTLKYRYLNSGSPSTANFFGAKDPILDIYMMEETVEMKTIERLFEEHQIEQCKLMKIDIQGAEYDVVASMSDLLRQRRIDYLIVENNPLAYKDRDMGKLLGDLGYAACEISTDGSLSKVNLAEPLKKGDYAFTYL